MEPLGGAQAAKLSDGGFLELAHAIATFELRKSCQSARVIVD